MFDVLDSGLNEYCEIIMQHFASSYNHCQLEIVLRMLKICSLSHSFVFYDVINQDCHLIEHIFPLITNDL